MKRKLINIGITLIIALFLYYFLLPPLNPSSFSFWLYLIIILIIYLSLSTFKAMEIIIKGKRINIAKEYIILSSLIGGIFAFIILINLCLSPIFNASKYGQRITVDETHEFTEDVAKVDFSKIPLLDKESSSKLGDRKMGQATDWVSQYYVSDLYTQINYNDTIIINLRI